MPFSIGHSLGNRVSQIRHKKNLNFWRDLIEVKFRFFVGHWVFRIALPHPQLSYTHRARVPRADLEFWADFRSIFAIEIFWGGGPPPPLSSNQALLRGGGTLHVQKRL